MLSAFIRESFSDYQDSVKKLVPNLMDKKHYTVDHDLGIVTIGGYKHPDLRLREHIGDEDSEIICYEDDPVFSSYPPQGVLKIGDEEILYYEKGKNRFYDCIRGYNSTFPEEHAIGSLVEDIRHGQGTSVFSDIYIGYTAIPRVEYEVTPSKERSANRTPFVDLKAINNAVSNNIIQISPTEVHASKLVLETNSPVISEGNLWGPVYYGTDFSRLTARVSDSSDNPVEGIDITIVLDSKVGNLNGAYKQYSAISNTLGEIYAIYNAPYDWESIRKVINEVVHDGTDTIFKTTNIPPGVTAEEVTVFQILKYDGNIGTVGMKMNVLQATKEHQAYGDPMVVSTTDAYVYKSSIIVDAVFEDAASKWHSSQSTDVNMPFHDLHVPDSGPACPGTANTNYGNAVASILFKNELTGGFTWVHRKILYAYDVWGSYDSSGEILIEEVTTWSTDNDAPDASCEPEHIDAHADYGDPTTGFVDRFQKERIGTRFVFQSALPTWVFDPEYTPIKCWAKERDAEVWSQTFKDGLDVVMYEWNEDATHPLGLDVGGAYYPIRPDSAVGSTIRFNDRILPKPDPSTNYQGEYTGIENILGGYNVVCPDMVECYAWCRDPVSGKVILSNRIRLKLVVPPYLEGVDRQRVGLGIPYGFGLVADEHNIVLSGDELASWSETGRGIGGANFLTINPAAEGIDAFSMAVNILI